MFLLPNVFKKKEKERKKKRLKLATLHEKCQRLLGGLFNVPK